LGDRKGIRPVKVLPEFPKVYFWEALHGVWKKDWLNKNRVTELDFFKGEMVELFKRLKPDIALHGNPFQSYGVSLAIWDHTCHPIQVNAPHHNTSQTGRYSIYLPPRDGRLSRPR